VSEDDIEKGKKKKRKSGTRMLDECAAPDTGKAVTPAGNPFSYPGGRNPVDRVSPPLTAGHQAPSSGDHGAQVDPMNVSGPRELAFRHPDLRNGTTSQFPLMSMRTAAGDNQAGDRDFTYVAGQVGLSRLDAAGATGMRSAPGNPSSRLLDYGARNSATPSNGTHGLGNPVSRSPAAMKSSEAREVLKRHMFPRSGAR
jgi:hypothetical protein